MPVPDDFVVKESDYLYSDPVNVKKWPGGKIYVMVGYVTKHPKQNCIVLTKEWTGKGGTLEERRFNISGSEDWIKIKEAIEKLWPEIGEVATANDISKAINKIGQETEILELLAQYPSLLSQIPQDVDILSLPENQKEALKRLLSVGGEIANSVISKLSEQPVQDLEQFVRLLEQLKLSTINSLITHITSRIGFINMFEKVIHSDESYERRGVGSVHNLMKANMWIVNRNYSILHNDETLKNIILAQWQKELNTKEGEKRPDFLCMVDKVRQTEGYKKIVIIEIKRPSIKINFEHIQQVMVYKMILQQHSGKSINDFCCYIIGREVSQELQINDLSKSGFIVKTYTDFISEARIFYEEYLEIVEQEALAI